MALILCCQLLCNAMNCFAQVLLSCVASHVSSLFKDVDLGILVRSAVKAGGQGGGRGPRGIAGGGQPRARGAAGGAEGHRNTAHQRGQSHMRTDGATLRLGTWAAVGISNRTRSDIRLSHADLLMTSCCYGTVHSEHARQSRFPAVLAQCHQTRCSVRQVAGATLKGPGIANKR